MGATLAISLPILSEIAVSAGIEETFGESKSTSKSTHISAECGDDPEGDRTCAFQTHPRCLRLTGTCMAGELGEVPVSTRCEALRQDAAFRTQADLYCVCSGRTLCLDSLRKMGRVCTVPKSAPVRYVKYQHQ